LLTADHGPDDDGSSEQQVENYLDGKLQDFFAAIDPRERFAQAVKESEAEAVLTPVDVSNMGPVQNSDGEPEAGEGLAHKSHAEIRQAFEKALAGLSRAGRDAIWQYTVKRKTPKEIARRLRKSRGQVTRYLRKGMALLGLNPSNGRLDNLFDFNRLT
jgi:RNA polymerase sigma factor (sigma-70 family)